MPVAVVFVHCTCLSPYVDELRPYPISSFYLPSPPLVLAILLLLLLPGAVDGVVCLIPKVLIFLLAIGPLLFAASFSSRSSDTPSHTGHSRTYFINGCCYCCNAAELIAAELVAVVHNDAAAPLDAGVNEPSRRTLGHLLRSGRLHSTPFLFSPLLSSLFHLLYLRGTIRRPPARLFLSFTTNKQRITESSTSPTNSLRRSTSQRS